MLAVSWRCIWAYLKLVFDPLNFLKKHEANLIYIFLLNCDFWYTGLMFYICIYTVYCTVYIHRYKCGLYNEIDLYIITSKEICSVSASVLSDRIIVLGLNHSDVMSLCSLISTQSLCGESLTCKTRQTQWSWIYLFSLFSLQQSVKFTFGLISHFSHLILLLMLYSIFPELLLQNSLFLLTGCSFTAVKSVFTAVESLSTHLNVVVLLILEANLSSWVINESPGDQCMCADNHIDEDRQTDRPCVLLGNNLCVYVW